MKVLVTGASGFVGRFLCRRLLLEGFSVRGTLLASENPSFLIDGIESVTVDPLGIGTSWNHALEGIDTIIHLAARVHIMDDSAMDPLTEFRRVNVDGTMHLASEAAKAGIKRFVFISSIKVNGEESTLPYTTFSTATPSDPYGVSKWEAEQALRTIESKTGMSVVVVRPTLVYGPGVKANFLNLLRIVSRGIPLPLASISNKRSLIYVGNLVDALTVCVTHPAAAGKTYLVSDGEDVSTPLLIRRIAGALGVSVYLLPFPVPLMSLIAKLIRKGEVANRLSESLTVDSSEIRRDLGWVQPYTMSEGLAETAKWFKKNMVNI